MNIKNNSVAYVDYIEDYYVSIYDITITHKDNNIIAGNDSNITDYDWKHQELLDIVPYKRCLCFSKEITPETYFLSDDSGNIKYGIMFVLRTSNNNIHYYYRRFHPIYPNTNEEYSPIIYDENITFSFQDITYTLKDYTLFTTNIDFTTNENILKINGEPCYFNK